MAETTKKEISVVANGDAYVLTAGIKYADIKNLIKYGKGAALKLVDKETKDELFQVGIGDVASASKYGVTFTGANSEGYAELTGLFPKVAMTNEEKKNLLRDSFAFVIPNLEAVEAQVVKESKALAAAIKAVDAAVKVD